MSLLGRMSAAVGSFLGRRGPQPPAEPADPVFEKRVAARYDAAQTTDSNSRHWHWADDHSADAGLTPEVRRELRRRARYETANNCYAKGIVLTVANFTVGTGPRLQLSTGSRAANASVEQAFADWAIAINLPAKLRQMRAAKSVDGESFALLTTNPALPTPVKLDLRVIEAEQIATPLFNPTVGNAVDGIVFDDAGNPVEYHLLRQHPGGNVFVRFGEFDPIPAESMLHYFRADRPGQHRGVPEIGPALPLFAQLRRFTLATLRAAEFAASPAGVMKTDGPAMSDAVNCEKGDAIPYELGSLLTLPKGWGIDQISPEHPATTYEMFKNQIISEIARCLNMPFNVAACNSASYNYASMRGDWITFGMDVAVEQDFIALTLLRRILAAWLDEAALVGILPRGTSPFGTWKQTFFWPARPHMDPTQEANAQQTKLANHTTTLADEYAGQGFDWEEKLRQRAAELALMRQLNIPLSIGGQPPQPGAADPNSDPNADPSADETATAAA